MNLEEIKKRAEKEKDNTFVDVRWSANTILQLVAEIERLNTHNTTLYSSRKEVMRDCDRLSKSYNFDQAQIKKLTNANKILRDVAIEAISRIDCSFQCTVNNGWAVKCSCGAVNTTKKLKQKLSEADEVLK